MSTRLKSGGQLIDRSQKYAFTFNGERLWGFAGDTLASALLANRKLMVGRSFKYHRPRGIVAAGPEEPNALMNLGEGGTFEPNQRATTTELTNQMTVASQNHWPSLNFDVGAINARFARFMPAGFYYKTFMFPRFAWKHLFEPFIRRAAGLGRAPVERDADRYEYFYAMTDVLVVGAGVAGLAAARVAAESGLRVLILEQNPTTGGRALVDGEGINDQPAADWIAAETAALTSMPNVTLRLRTMASGVYDHGYVLGYERVSEHVPKGADLPRHRLWRIRASRIITATGAIERPLSFAGNDVPGVMLAAAVRDYAALYGVSCGDRTVVVTNNDDAYRTALAMADVGLTVPVVLDARPEGGGALAEEARARGIRVENGKAIARVIGGKFVRAVEICDQAGEGTVLETIECDCVAMSGGWSPVVHLWSHCGGKLNWDDTNAMFSPDPARPPLGADGKGMVIAAGAAAGALAQDLALANAHSAGRQAVEELGQRPGEVAAPSSVPIHTVSIMPVWTMPQGADRMKMAKAFLDYQNDVKVSDVRLAAREGYESVEHTKRYTTLGMATDQGKLSNINGLAILAEQLAAPIPAVGTTTFRPPYHPISMGAIAGEARGDLFKVLRRSPMHDWHDANGADWEPVADWRRPYTYLRAGESKHDAVNREILNTRNGLGMLDASTLGKIVVKGPDAGKFLDLMYTNMMSTLKIGRCRYGLMCNENGFLIDDGVVARIGEDEFLCHTTSGGSDRIHAHMEEWLQTEWWDLKAYTINLTEQFAQIAVVGPKARKALEKLGGMDVSAETLPFMAFADGELAGLPVRAYRISFSGELSYEIAVPASQGLELWAKIHEAGQEFGVMPYGTEALHVMRAEKGFIMIGDESDGTVIPQDLALDWAVSKKKEDFLGKRGMQRSFMTQADRKQLVGLETLDPKVVLPDCAHAIEGKTPEGRDALIGHVTSTYWSPTLDRSIAMAIIKGGSRRMGEVLSFPIGGGKIVQAKVVNPVFLDPEGARQNV